MVGKLLIATDGSKFSNKAVDYAMNLAKQLQCEVIVLYVLNLKHFELYALTHHDDITGYEDEDLKLKKEGEDALSFAIAKGEECGVRMKTRMVRGYPPEQIMKIAKDDGVDLIVVGNLGKSGIDRILLGSVSEAVVRNAPCPVLVVRGK
ncbi:MAG: universal stress protein [Candidatus Doudnabacteria bacterium]